MQKINLKHSRSAFLSVLIGTSVLPYVKAGSSDLEHGKLDAFHLLVASKYFKNSTDFMNASMVSKKYATTIDKLLYNPIEVTPDTVKNFSHLQTLHIYDVRNLVDHDGNRTLTLDELEKIIKERYAEVDNRIHKYVIWTNDPSLLSKKEYHNLEFRNNHGSVHYYIDKSKENSDIKIDIDSLYENSILAGRYNCPVKELFIEGDVESIKSLSLEIYGVDHSKAIHIAPSIKHIGSLKISGSPRKIDIEGENVQIDSTNGNILPRGKDLSINAVEYKGCNVGSVRKDELLVKENISDKEKNEALSFACENGQLNVVKYLVEEKGADVNAENGKALGNAASRGNLEIVKYLVDHGADVANDRYALGNAAENGHLDIVKYLVEEKGVDVNDELDSAASRGHLDMVKYLVEHGADVDADYTLSNAARSGNLELVKYLVEHGADVNVAGKYGNTPLIWAAREGHLDIVKYLVEKGADVNAKDHIDRTPLILAARESNLDMVKYLVEKGANVNARNSDGETPLFHTAENGHLDMVKYLVDHGADVNAGLSSAARSGNLELVKCLVDHGADVNAGLSSAARSGNLELVKCLVDHGADVANDGWALREAAENGHLDIVKYLKEHGAVDSEE